MFDMDKRVTYSTYKFGSIRMILDWVVWVGRVAAWLIMPILGLVLIGVVLSAAQMGIIVRWEADIFLLGSKLTLASLGDLQWHLFGIMLMLTMASALIGDKHVRVDFLRQHMRERGKKIIDIIGHLIFLFPLCIILIIHGYEFTMRSFTLGEGSDYDGLYDRFVLKAFVPIGFGLLLLAGAGLLIQAVLALFGKGKGKGR